MAGKAYGVVLADGRHDVFDHWDQAQRFIKTYPSNARYKSFKTRADAENYVQSLTQPQSQIKNNTQGKLPAAIAYVDGSFNQQESKWGYGVVLYDASHPEVKIEFKGCGTAFAEHRNITGEIYGAMIAVKEAIRREMKSITIYHDYAGIADWVTGAWEARTEMTQKYTAYMTAQKRKIDIDFVKVAGHTGVELNERCDVLAKSACGVK